MVPKTSGPQHDHIPLKVDVRPGLVRLRFVVERRVVELHLSPDKATDLAAGLLSGAEEARELEDSAKSE